MTSVPPDVARAASDADAALGRLAAALERLGDGDLHRAHSDGGWTVAQVVSHLNLANILWLGNLTRLQADPDLGFLYREEIGHDAVGYPPPTTAIALGQLAATRRSIATAVPALSAELLARTVEIPDLGTRTVQDWMPAILGHVSGHTDQAFEIMRNRGFAPDEV